MDKQAETVDARDWMDADRSGYNEAGQFLVIDGTDESDNYAGDAVDAPFVVFNVDTQTNVAGPFDDAASAKAALDSLIVRAGDRP